MSPAPAPARSSTAVWAVGAATRPASEEVGTDLGAIEDVLEAPPHLRPAPANESTSEMRSKWRKEGERQACWVCCEDLLGPGQLRVRSDRGWVERPRLAGSRALQCAPSVRTWAFEGAAFAAETAPAKGRGWRRTFRLSRTCTSTATLISTSSAVSSAAVSTETHQLPRTHEQRRLDSVCL